MQLFLYLSYLLFLLVEITLNRMFRSKSSDKKNADRKSILILWGTICLSLFFAYTIARKIELPIYIDSKAIYLSLVFLYGGIIIRLFAVYSLGKYFTVDVTIRNEHRLITGGLFKYVRHPNYLALLLCFLALGIGFNNWISLAVVLIPITIAFLIRINIEEKVLLEHFGNEYFEYTKRTKRLIPYIF